MVMIRKGKGMVKKKLFHFARGNHKLSKEQLVWSLPRILTCPGAGECKKYCYAKKAEQVYKNVVPSRIRNWKFTRTKDFVKLVVAHLQRSGKTVVRIHEAGDFYDREYLLKWKKIARRLPGIRFYAFTKSFQLRLWKALPKNLVIIQSYGSRWDFLIDTTKNTARVIDDASDIRSGEYLCPYHSTTFTKCGDCCSYCFDNVHKVKHVAFQRH